MKRQNTSSSQSTVEDIIGLVKDRYLISSQRIGLGAEGQVFKGLDMHTKKQLAFKKFIKPIQKDQFSEEFYNREVRALKDLRGKKNILQFENAFVYNKQNYIVTELCKGGNLKKQIKQRKMSKQTAYSLMIQIVGAYLQIYNNNYIHRDLKPSNIMLTQHSQIKVGDFGFAIKDNETQNNSAIKVGSVNYMAPEIIKDNLYSFKSDIWALGVIFYELIVGKKLWNSDDYEQILRMQNKYCQPSRHFAMSLEADAKNFLMKTMCLNVNHRAQPKQLLSLLPKKSPQKIIKKVEQTEISKNIQHHLNLYDFYIKLADLIVVLHDSGQLIYSLKILIQLAGSLLRESKQRLSIWSSRIDQQSKWNHTILQKIQQTKQLNLTQQRVGYKLRKRPLSCSLLNICLLKLHENITTQSDYRVFLVYDYLVTLRWIQMLMQKQGIEYIADNIVIKDIVDALIKNTKKSIVSPDKIKLEHLSLLQKKLRQLNIVT